MNKNEVVGSVIGEVKSVCLVDLATGKVLQDKMVKKTYAYATVEMEVEVLDYQEVEVVHPTTGEVLLVEVVDAVRRKKR